MSGPGMAEMADIVDAADGAAVQTAQAGDQAPPVLKASPPTVQETQAVPISVDDTPTEPATSPRRVGTPVQEWAVEVQLPTREYGPRPEPEVYPTPFVMNDGQWTPQEHLAHLHKAAHATLVHVWNREAREEAERHNREYAQSMAEWRHRVQGAGFKARPAVAHGPPPKGVSSTRVLPGVHDALRQHEPSKAPASQPALPKKAPPTTGKGMPAGCYRVEGLVPERSSQHQTTYRGPS